MGIKMTKQQIREAMKDNVILLDSVTQSKEWRLMPGDSLSVIMGMLAKTDQLRVDELRPHQHYVALLSPLKLRKALSDLVERGLIVRTLTKADRYALNFPPYAK